MVFITNLLIHKFFMSINKFMSLKKVTFMPSRVDHNSYNIIKFIIIKGKIDFESVYIR